MPTDDGLIQTGNMEIVMSFLVLFIHAKVFYLITEVRITKSVFTGVL